MIERPSTSPGKTIGSEAKLSRSQRPGSLVFTTIQQMTEVTSMITVAESAAMSGASWVTTFRRVILPLLKPGLVAGWIYVMIVSIRELSSSILLYSPGTEVLSITIWELWENGQYVELSALGVLFILALFVLVMVAQWLGKRFGVKE